MFGKSQGEAHLIHLICVNAMLLLEAIRVSLGISWRTKLNGHSASWQELARA